MSEGNTKIDRLLDLVGGGGTRCFSIVLLHSDKVAFTTRKLAATRLGQFQSKAPQDLPLLVHKLLPLFKSESWDIRASSSTLNFHLSVFILLMNQTQHIELIRRAWRRDRAPPYRSSDHLLESARISSYQSGKRPL